jgi:hypothetical protein
MSYTPKHLKLWTMPSDYFGAALYILRPGDVTAGADIDAYYSRGIAVYK